MDRAIDIATQMAKASAKARKGGIVRLYFKSGCQGFSPFRCVHEREQEVVLLSSVRMICAGWCGAMDSRSERNRRT